jgi:MFS family permease
VNVLAASPSEVRGSASQRYASFVLGMLVLVYAVNFMDRYVFIISMEAIKQDLKLSDTQLGLITGFGFSVVYSFAGLLAAYWAGLGNRRSIIAAALAAWSGLTMVCAAARSFGQLMIARMSVGLAESACSPPALALLADYFPLRLRGRAFGIYSVGLNLGLCMGFVIGGWVGEHYGWRAAFLAGGIPGLLLAALVRLTVREPPRGAADDGAVDAARYTLGQAALYLLARPSFGAFILGSSLYTFVGTTIDSWAPVFLMRVHGLDSAVVGLRTGVLGAVAGTVGSVAAGWIADRVAVRDLRHNLWVATCGIAFVAPLTLVFLFSNVRAVWGLYAAAQLFNCFYMAPTLAVTHAVMPVRLRALASALLLLGYNIIGTAGCSFVIGYLSDHWAGTLHVDSVRFAMAATQGATVLGIACTVYGIVRLPRDFPEHFPS